MTASTLIVEADVEPDIQEQVSAVLAERGLSISEVVRSLLIQTAQNKELPFEPFIPNAVTIAAMEDARAGRVTRATDIDDLFRQLNADT